MPKPMSDEQYVELSGIVCPLCHVRDRIRSLGDLQQDDVHIYQDCACDACGGGFQDRYILAGYYDETSDLLKPRD